MSRDEVMALQRQLKAAGLYSGPIDGTIGNETRTAQEKYQALTGARTAEAAAKQAAAEADAKRAEVEAARVKAEADRQAHADKRADERAQAKRDAQGFRSVATAGGLVAGFAGGKMLAHLVDKRFVASINAKNTALGNLAGVAAKTGAPAASAAAARAGLKGARAPLGIGLAAALLAEAAYTRFAVSPTLEDSPVSQALSDSAATASTMAAIALVGQQAINRRTPTVVLDAAALATIETGAKTPPAAAGPKPGTVSALKAEAKGLGIPGAAKMRKADLQKAIASAKPPAAATTAAGGGLRRLLGRAVPAVAAALFAGAGYAQAARAGASQADAVKAGAKAGADALTAGAVTSFEQERSRGGSTAIATVTGVIEGAANFLTLGAVGLIADTVKSRPTINYVPSSVAKRAVANGRVGGMAYLNAAAKAKAQTLPALDVAMRGSAGRPAILNGKISYSTLDGRTVQATEGQAKRWRAQRKR